MSISELSRRDFFKITGAGALGLVLSELGLSPALAAPPSSQGRITWSGIPLYDQPALTANKLYLFPIDDVVELLGEVEGGGIDNKFNNVWYQLDGGYTYSGWVQPVETNYQRPFFDVPPEGKLAEISVPWTLTYLSPYTYAKNAHRLFYGSTHWIKKVIVTRDEKSVWYETYDKELKGTFYIPAHNMRVIPDDELTQLSPEVPPADKLIHVDLTTQMTTAFEGEKMVFSVRCSTGQRGTDTPKGEFTTYHKGPSIHMSNQGDAVNNIYNLPGVPWCAFFTGAGHSFHGTYWHNDYGRPRSHGCVNLSSDLAKWIYRWTMPVVPVGTEYVNLPGEGTRIIVE